MDRGPRKILHRLPPRALLVTSRLLWRQLTLSLSCPPDVASSTWGWPELPHILEDGFLLFISLLTISNHKFQKLSYVIFICRHRMSTLASTVLPYSVTTWPPSQWGPQRLLCYPSRLERPVECSDRSTMISLSASGFISDLTPHRFETLPVTPLPAAVATRPDQKIIVGHG